MSINLKFRLFLWLLPLALAPQAGRAAAAHNIAVFGDSLADGVWSGLYQEVKRNPGDQVFRDSKVGTGLTRPDADEFVQGFIAKLDTDHVTDAVVMFGANDEESLRDETHKGYVFKSPGWQKIYAGRVTAIIAACQQRHVRVVWLGLPILRDPVRQDGALFLNGLLADTVTKDKAVFMPLEDDFKDSQGAFATHLPDAKGDLRDVRAQDGVHFSFYGYDEIAKKTYAAIRATP